MKYKFIDYDIVCDMTCRPDNFADVPQYEITSVDKEAKMVPITTKNLSRDMLIISEKMYELGYTVRFNIKMKDGVRFNPYVF